MRVGLIAQRLSEGKLKEITKSMQVKGINIRTLNLAEISNLISQFDLIIVIGSDGDVLRVIQAMHDKVLPVLGVSDSNELGFLTEISLPNFKQAIDKLVKRDYVINRASRLSARVNNQPALFALNEVALFPSKSATLLEYSLKVDGEFVWRDYCDGVIISTPTGSTAYAMSAGGPMVLQSANVFLIVPVNSMDVTRRPLVVSESSIIEIEEITSRYECEAVIDGIYRIKAKGKLVVENSNADALLIRLSKTSTPAEKMSRKVKLAEELFKMPPSAKLVLKTLQYEGPLTQREIVKKTMLPERTARLALHLLIEKGLVKRHAMLRDARQKLYYATTT
jgi:NAD+ kinase